MFRGGPELSAAQLSYLSAAMGGEFDASTQQTMTQYVFTVAAEDLDVALRVEAIRMRGVSDSEAAWRQERGAIEQEVAQNLSNPQYLLYTKLLAALFEGTPYARDALGTKASFDRTTGAMLKKFGDTWYAPNNAILVVVGDVQPDAALARIKTHFGRLRPKALPRRPDVVLRPVRPRTLYLPTDQASGLAVVAFRVPGFADADYAAMRVLADVLGKLARRPSRPGGGRDTAGRRFFLHPAPQGGARIRRRRLSPGQEPFPRVRRADRGAAGHGRQGRRRRSRRGREAARHLAGRVPEDLHPWAGVGMVGGARRRGTAIAERRGGGDSAGDGGRRQPRRAPLPRFRPGHHRDHDAETVGQSRHLEGVRGEGVVHPAEHEAGRVACLGGRRGEAAGGAAVDR